MNFTLFLNLLRMIPAIISLVQAAEVAIPGIGKGKDKLNLILSTVGAASTAATTASTAIQSGDLNGAVTAIVGGTVTSLNAAGIFSTTVGS